MGAEAAVTQLRRGAVEHCVLALLEDDERYGYDLVQQLTAAGLVASEGTVYPLLSRLRKDELVATVWRDSPSGPPRRYYALTRPGQRALQDFRVAWTEFSKAVESILRPAPTTAADPTTRETT